MSVSLRAIFKRGIVVFVVIVSGFVMIMKKSAVLLSLILLMFVMAVGSVSAAPWNNVIIRQQKPTRNIGRGSLKPVLDLI